MRRKGNEDVLTDDEIAFLRSDRSSPVVRQFAARQHESIGTRTSAYRKVARAARAERDAIMEIAALELARAVASGERAAKERAVQLERENSTLRAGLEAAHRRIEAATARPAMAVYAEGSGG